VRVRVRVKQIQALSLNPNLYPNVYPNPNPISIRSASYTSAVERNHDNQVVSPSSDEEFISPSTRLGLVLKLGSVIG
jgi:hypothetical protein